MSKETTLIIKQKQALEQEEKLIKDLKAYKKTLEKISIKLISTKNMIGSVELFKTETPSLIVQSRINQKALNELTIAIDRLNSEIASIIRRI